MADELLITEKGSINSLVWKRIAGKQGRTWARKDEMKRKESKRLLHMIAYAREKEAKGPMPYLRTGAGNSVKIGYDDSHRHWEILEEALASDRLGDSGRDYLP